MQSPSVVIVGGGLAGMAAAGALAQRGLGVTLLESRPRWGGRASSFVDQATGEVIDNCQHVFLGCCNNFRDLLTQAGCEGMIRREPVLWFVGPEGSPCRFDASRLPAPLHLAPALWRLKYLSVREKLTLAKGLRSLARLPDNECSPNEALQTWLERHGQSPRLIERFWSVVLVSALSESLDRVDIGHARKVFVEGFLRNRDGWEMWVPSVSLDELYGRALIGWLEKLGVQVRTQSGVRRIVVDGNRAVGVELRSGERLQADNVIAAVPHHVLLDLLPPAMASLPELAAIRKLEDSPISSVHLWFDRKVFPLPHAVLVGRLGQWVFDRPAGVSGGQLLQVVISASRSLQGRPQGDVIREVTEELAAIWPSVRAARLDHSRVITEHRATLSVAPGVDRLRPAQQTSIANLQLAGDWTRTGWPSTMEGAVRSGRLAARNVLEHLGCPEPLLAAEPATSRLSRWLFGI